MVQDSQVSPVALVLRVPLRCPVLWVLWVTLVCPGWMENMVSRALPVPQVPPVQAPLRGIEVTVGSLDSPEL